MQGSRRLSSVTAICRRAGSQLPNDALKSSRTSSGMICDSGSTPASNGPATSAVPKPAMPNTT